MNFAVSELDNIEAMDAFDDFLIGAAFGIAIGSLFLC